MDEPLDPFFHRLNHQPPSSHEEFRMMIGQDVSAVLEVGDQELRFPESYRDISADEINELSDALSILTACGPSDVYARLVTHWFEENTESSRVDADAIQAAIGELAAGGISEALLFFLGAIVANEEYRSRDSSDKHVKLSGEDLQQAHRWSQEVTVGVQNILAVELPTIPLSESVAVEIQLRSPGTAAKMIAVSRLLNEEAPQLRNQLTDLLVLLPQLMDEADAQHTRLVAASKQFWSGRRSDSVPALREAFVYLHRELSTARKTTHYVVDDLRRYFGSWNLDVPRGTAEKWIKKT